VVFDREKQGAYALEVEARDGAPSARPNSNSQPNSGMILLASPILSSHCNLFKLTNEKMISLHYCIYIHTYNNRVGIEANLSNRDNCMMDWKCRTKSHSIRLRLEQ
jgi:hypothetical protein